MTDIEIAIASLSGHTLALCRDGELITSDARGIKPMMELIKENRDLRGYSAADVVVGKAAAMLFKKAGITAVYAKTLSKSGKAFLCDNGIAVSCDVLTDNIINRSGTDICPMEKAVLNTDDAEAGYKILLNKLSGAAGNI